MSKNDTFNAFLWNVNTINWKIFPTHVGIYKSEKIQQAFWKDKRNLKKKKFFLYYTNKQRAHNIEIKNIYKEITTLALNLMNHFKSHKVDKITSIK